MKQIIDLFIRSLYFQSFLIQELTMVRFYFYRETIESNLVKESQHEKNGHCVRSGIRCNYIYIVLYRVCIQTVCEL